MISVDAMRAALAEQAIDGMDDHGWFIVMLDGCKGYNNLSDKDIKEEYETIFGA